MLIHKFFTLFAPLSSQSGYNILSSEEPTLIAELEEQSLDDIESLDLNMSRIPGQIELSGFERNPLLSQLLFWETSGLTRFRQELPDDPASLQPNDAALKSIIDEIKENTLSWPEKRALIEKYKTILDKNGALIACGACGVVVKIRNITPKIECFRIRNLHVCKIGIKLFDWTGISRKNS